MMSKDKLAATSPTRFNGELDHFFDPNFTEEISHRMQVPKRIKVNGENEDDVVIGVGGHNPPPVWETEKFDMHVPDRILVVDNPDPEYCSSPRKGGTSLPLSRVKSSDTMMSIHSNWRHTSSFSVPIPRSDGPLSRPLTGCTTYRPRSLPTSGKQDDVDIFDVVIKSGLPDICQDQLIGTRGTPIEVNHENAVLPPDPGLIRVQTPPRVITLTDHYFPSADDVPSPIVDEPTPISAVIRPSRPQAPLESDDRRNEIHTVREGTPSFAEGMTTNEEVAHLRRQLAKLNRRVMSIELENLQRQQYEKIVFLLGAAYAVWKTLLWLRNS